MDARAHVSEVFRWAAGTEVDPAKALASAIGMAGPVLIGAAAGHLSAGLAASVGAFILGGVDSGPCLKAQAKALVSAIGPVALAVIVAALTAGHGWRSDATVALLVCAAATIGPYSRSMFAAMTRFNLVLVIMANFAETAANAPGFLVLLAAGALLSAATNLIFGGVVRAFRQRDQGKTAATPPVATASQRFARWKRSLRNLSGWQYTLRLALCLGVATLLRLLWPSHHLYWVALTVVLLAEREIERLPVKTTQRALGTTIGVIGAGLIIAERPSAWVIAIGFGLLAGLRPLLRVKNYLAYSAVMTPLVILMMDAGHAIDMGVAMDRLFATLVGAFLVIATNRMFWILLGKTPGVRAPISNRPNR